ncbi:sugar kinase [Anoxybacteroides tepidamans]|uniref:sugar kinase n=1 Tax=Anoxybacteroides tepidamans TaxID=265948 RepID=UPI00054F0A9B|nr:sugar kinase [Anoxybacillus tepidamans]
MQQNNNVDVVTIGESMILFQPMADGSLRYSPLFTKSMAGAESNVAIGLTRLGKKVRWISRVGCDPFGDFIVSTLAGEGVDVSCVIRDEKAPTAIYFKEFKGYGDPTVYYYRKYSAASKFSEEDIQSEWFANARHLHVTGITPALGERTADFIKKVMEQAKANGLTVSFDPNLRRKLWSEEQARRVLSSLIPLCDIFLPGLEEAKFLIGEQPIAEYGRQFLQMGPQLVVVKLGQEGAIGFYQNEAVQAPAFRLDKVVDTIGAGDAFAAGLLSALLDEGEPLSAHVLKKRLPQALKQANLLGALATQFKGDWEGLPSIREVEQYIEGQEMIKR